MRAELEGRPSEYTAKGASSSHDIAAEDDQAEWSKQEQQVC